MKVMKELKDIAVCALLAVAFFLTVRVGEFVDEARRTLVTTQQSEMAIASSVASAAAALDHVAMTTDRYPKILDSQMTRLNANLDGRLSEVTLTVDQRTGVLVEAAAKALDQSTASITKAADAVTFDVREVTVPAGLALSKINETLPYYTDCDAGMCFPNHIYGAISKFDKAMTSVDVTMGVVAKQAPVIGESFAGVAVAAHREADYLTRPRKWYQQVATVGFAAARAIAGFL